MLMQGNVLVLDGNELFHGVQIRMLQIMPQSITAHHLLCIRNIKQYLLATLYNAPVTVDSYYSAQVRHEFGWGSRVDKN